jgi:hypothetical protein
VLEQIFAFKASPEVDQQQGGTRPVGFSSDVENLRILFERFCGWKHDFAAHAMIGQCLYFS